MSVLNCLKCGYASPKTFCFRANIIYVRQYYMIRCGTVQIVRDAFTNKDGMVRYLATKTRTKIKRPRPRTAEDDKQLKKGGRARSFFMYTVPMLIVFTIVSAVVVLAFGMLQSVKDTARDYYKDTPAGLYKEAFAKCTKDSKVKDILGETIEEVMVDGKSEKVKLTRKQVYKTLVIKMQFNIQGSKLRGRVDMEVTKTDEEDFQFKYLLVNVDGHPTITIEDNR